MKEKLSYLTTKAIRSLIDRSLKFAFEKKNIDTKTQVEIQIKNKSVKKVEALEKFEKAKIEKYILDNKKYYHYGVLICLYTGLRLGEMVALKWQNVDFKNKIIYIEKSVSTISQNRTTFTIEDTHKIASSVRVIPISKQFNEIFKKFRKTLKDFLFVIYYLD